MEVIALIIIIAALICIAFIIKEFACAKLMPPDYGISEQEKKALENLNNHTENLNNQQ